MASSVATVMMVLSTPCMSFRGMTLALIVSITSASYIPLSAYRCSGRAMSLRLVLPRTVLARPTGLLKNEGGLVNTVV